MSRLLEHRGYRGSVEPDLDAGYLVGEVLHIADTLTYHGDTIYELEKAFCAAVDVYLAFCEERGKTPDKPMSGNIMVRVGAEAQRAAMIAAAQEGVSLNQWIGGAIDAALKGEKGRKPLKPRPAAGTGAEKRTVRKG